MAEGLHRKERHCKKRKLLQRSSLKLFAVEMDLPCPEWIKHVEQKWTQLESATSERFSVFTDIDDLFHFGLSQLQSVHLFNSIHVRIVNSMRYFKCLCKVK